MLITILAIFGISGDVAHFFLRAIWTNEIKRIVNSEAGLAIAFMRKALKIEEEDVTK